MARKKKKKPAAEVPDLPVEAAVSSRYRFFLWICAFFATAGLLIGVDVITVWPGAEGYALDLALSNERGSYLPAFIYGSMTEAGAGLFPMADLFFLFPRIFSAGILLLTVVLFYRWGKPLFGVRTVELQLLLIAASLWLPFFGKMATADSWLVFSHVGLWLSFIYLIRAGRVKHQLYVGVFALIGGIVAPFSTIVLVLGLCAIMAWRYDTQRVLKLGWPAAVVPLVALLVHGNHPNEIYFSDFSSVLIYAFVGTLPFVGFAVGGIRDLIFKLRKREELAIIFAAALLPALLAGSPLFAIALSLLAGKQLQLYFSAGYPWNNWVRGPAILHLIFALIGSFLLLLGGFVTFRGDGYRAFLGMVAAYWIFSLLGVLGIYGMRRDFTIGGAVLSGVLATLFFWVQVYPYFETERNWPTELIELSEKRMDLDSQSSKVYVNEQSELSTALPYLRRAEIETVNSPEAATLKLIMTPPTDSLTLESSRSVSGRSFLLLHRFGWAGEE